MKKNYVLIFAAGLVLLATACNKNEVDGQSATQEKDAVVTYIKATAKEDDTKASIDNSTGDFTWNTGDKIAVWADGYVVSDPLESTYDGTNAATFSFSGLDESKRANFAIYPADFANSTYYTDTDLQVNLPSSYTLAQVRDNVSPLPMIATNVEDGNLSFKQLCALLRVTVNNIPPSAKRLELNFHDNKVHGSFTATLEGGIVKPAISTIATEGSSANDIITITKDGTDVTLNSGAWLDNLVLNIPIPVGTYTKVTVTAYDALTSGNAILTMTRPIKVSANWTATRANARKCTASLPAFSVDASHRVAFAPGNLYWDGSAWQFHSEQYGTTFGAYTNPLQPTGGDNTAARRTAFLATHNRDLFQWTEMTGGVSGQSINFGTINGYNDWKVGDDYSYVIGSGLASRSGYRFVKMVLPFSKGFPDHTKTFASGETPAVMWGGTPGVFIFPDYWDGDLLTSFMKQKFSNTTPAQYRYNNISAHFESNASTETALDNDMTMEKYQQLIMAGAIFLPASGRVNASCNFVLGSSSTNTSKIFCDGGMWTCTAGTSSAITSNGAYIAFFHNDGFSMNAVLSQSQYHPVRLVRDLN